MAELTHTENAILTSYKRLSAAKRILNGTGDPVVACRLCRQRGAEFVELRSTGPGKAWIGKVQHCKRIWVCAICSLQISNERRRKLAALVELERGKGNSAAMITYTFSHQRGDSLKRGLGVLKTAHGAMHSGRKWNEFVKRIGWLGSVKATEITITPNGWHPHAHEIAFIAGNELSKDELSAALDPGRAMWLDALCNVGADGSIQRALDIVPAYGPVSDYVGKWAIVPELVNGAHKTGREGSVVPFQLLDVCADQPTNSALEANLFYEYREQVFGLHQLHPSPYCKAAMRVDPDPVELIDDESLLATLDSENWQIIVNRDLRAQCIIAARAGVLDSFLLRHSINRG